ncbi:beta strand repeat-containing protein [Mesorhizobium sp. ES1-4]|uniref:beta strand repeat-containing protein n=1 Tax=Mesorhizobium sp. ES1-4 TaxID=2876627 RepID=UPI001CC9DB5E|nr:autotransporter outer membrane beta-barrel domain-containing protein [Mesorhizobium sp. ES1-4]MBZ9794284.1 autotransporter outer membrane beta-barrel domain-containing protein [Mesorhizobium sp. ES1-4]
MAYTSGSEVAFTRGIVQLCPRRRRLLLLGTALGSTLIAFSASPSFAGSCTQALSPTPITVTGAATPISCTNTAARTATVAGDNAIGIVTTGSGNTVDITNSGLLTTNPTSLIPGPSFSQSKGARGIYAGTNGIGADITINNTGTINSYSDSIKAVSAATSGPVSSSDTHISITNSGNLTAGPNAEGIFANASYGSNNAVTIDNSGAIQTGASASMNGTSSGIFADVDGDNGKVNVTNNGAISTTGASAAGISAIASYYHGDNSSIVINNKSGGTITTTGVSAYGIFAQAGSIAPTNSPPNPDNGGTVKITNASTVSAGYMGIAGFTYGTGGNITIDNKGNVTSGTGGADGSDGIKASSNSGNSTITITNAGNIDTTSGGDKSVGIEAVNGPGFTGSNLNISVTNSGNITTAAESVGIKAASTGANGVVTVDNSGAIQTGASVSTIGGSTGIFADADGDNTKVSVTNSGAITTIGTSAAGISAIANYYNGNNGSVVVNNRAGGTITTTGNDAYGVFAQAGSIAPSNNIPNPNNGGTVKITNAATVSAGYIGVAGFTYGTGGNITIDNKGNVTSGTGGAGGSDGIKASANSGDSTITITNTGNIDTTSGGDKSVGIEAVNGPGFDDTGLVISVTNSGDITTAAESAGIKAASTGANGIVTVDNSGAIQTGASVTTNGGSTGIFADVNGDNSLVKVTNSGAITTSGTTAAGISAIANYYGVSSGNVIVPTNNGSVVVNNKAGGDITTTGSDAFGIFAQAGSVNPQNQSPNADNGGTVTVTNAATINSGGKGIGAYTYGSNGTVTVTNSGDINSTNEEGIYAKSNGDNSNVIVTNSGSVNAYGGVAGLAAYTSGADSNIVITNNKNSNLYGVGFGVIAETTGAASIITVTTDGEVYGELGGIKVNSTGGATVNVGTTGYVGADNYLAIKSTIGTVEINDNGVIAGRVELSDAGNVMNIDDKGTFRAFTNSTFGAGNDTLNNAGIVNASGSYFGSSPNTVTLSGLENFVNGSLGSGPGLTTMIDGVVGDSLTTSGNFTGQGNSKLGVDANFSNNTADTLTIGGNSYGHTNLVVNVTAIAPGVPTAVFIPVVTVTGTTSDSNFDVPAPVNAGLFAYDLFLQGQTHGLRYVGLGNAAFELPAGITGAQNVWQDTTGFWQDRMADLRTEAAGTHNADMPEENLKTRMGGIWARASGNWSSQDGDTSYTDPISQQTETLNLDRRQRTGAFLGGIDMGLEGVAGGDMLFGVMAGYVTSKLDFKATDDSWDYKGGTVGAYATYLNGGFYLDGLVKADFLNVDINDDQGRVSDKTSTNATNIGVRLDTGYRVATSWGFVEPQASLEWVHTTMDSLSIFGGDVDFQNGSSGRARIGVRIGTDMQMKGMTVSPDLTLSIWNHFGSDNAVNIDFPGNAFSATDSAGNGTTGEIGVGVNVASASNWSGVLRGSVRFGDHYSAGSIGAAIRYGW